MASKRNIIQRLGQLKSEIVKLERDIHKHYEETCITCGKKSCNLAGVGNQAGINENDGCWIPKEEDIEVYLDLTKSQFKGK
jgi:hypothetical protein